MKKKDSSIPYVPVVGFEKAIQVLKNEKPGSYVDKSALERKGVSGNTYYQVMKALRFLNLIDGNKQVTPDLPLWVKGKEGRLKIVQSAYKPLLEGLSLPARNNVVLKKTIKDTYGMADSVVLLAATFFTWAARQGGIDVLDGDMDGVPRRGRGAKPGLQRRRVGRPRKIIGARGRRGRRPVPESPRIVFNVNLQISKDTKKEHIHRMITDLKDELKDFWAH